MEMKLKDSKLTELQKKYDDLEAGSMNKQVVDEKLKVQETVKDAELTQLKAGIDEHKTKVKELE